MKITAITRLKHAALLEAAEDFGGVPKLAEHLGVHVTQLYSWIAMRLTPPRGVNTRAWPPERLAQLESDLMQVTGQTMEQLFPDAYRDAVIAGIPRLQKETREVEHDLLLAYAHKTTQRLEYEHPSEWLDRPEILAKCRKRLTPRESRIIDMRFTDNMTLKECGDELRICSQRVQQIERVALRKMKNAIENLEA